MRSMWWRFMLAGVLILSVTAPNVSKSAPVGKRLWDCSWDMSNSFRFQSSYGYGNDSASIIGNKGLCTLRIGVFGGTGEEHLASLSASWREEDVLPYSNLLFLGSCDKDPDVERNLYIRFAADAILRLDPEEPGERMIRFKISFNGTPFPGPFVQRATFGSFDGKRTSNESLTFETRIGGACPPAGNFVAQYRLFFREL